VDWVNDAHLFYTDWGHGIHKYYEGELIDALFAEIKKVL
jgi:hypothetical protein